MPVSLTPLPSLQRIRDPELRRILTTIDQNQRAIAQQTVTKADLAAADVVVIDANGTMTAKQQVDFGHKDQTYQSED